jgi:hypothetical protein
MPTTLTYVWIDRGCCCFLYIIYMCPSLVARWLAADRPLAAHGPRQEAQRRVGPDRGVRGPGRPGAPGGRRGRQGSVPENCCFFFFFFFFFLDWIGCLDGSGNLVIIVVSLSMDRVFALVPAMYRVL